MDVERYQHGWNCLSNGWLSHQSTSIGIVSNLIVGLDAGPRRDAN